jgi:[ribosomal protein S18]-alanine N-acetyltransferase
MQSHFLEEPIPEKPLQSVRLAALTKELLPAVVTLDQKVFGGFWKIKAYQQELERTSSDLLAIWPLEPSAPPDLLALGCSWLILDEAHILMIAVHPEFRQRSLGEAILLGLLERARNRGASYATLEVKDSNCVAIALYEKLGLKIAGRRPHYYEDTGEDALIMWRSGLQSSDFEAQIAQHWQTIEQQQHWSWQRKL